MVAADGPALYWVNGDGFAVPRTLEQVGNTSIITGPVNLFVNPVSGNDANPGTLAAPLKTLPAALLRSAKFRSTVQNTITLEAGVFNLGANPVLTIPDALPGAQPLLIQGTLVDSGLGAIAAAGGTAPNIVTAALGTITGVPGGVPNKSVGTWISGPNAARRFIVAQNIAGTADVLANVMAAPVAGNQYTVGTFASFLTWTGKLSWQGGSFIQDSVQRNTSDNGQNFVTEEFLCNSVQSNACNTVAGPAVTFTELTIACPFTSGLNNYGALAIQPCPDIYDGSAMVGGLGFNIFSVPPQHPNFRATFFDTVVLTANATSSAITINGVHVLHNGAMAADLGGSIIATSGNYSGLVSAAGVTGVGPGCLAARLGSKLSFEFCNITASGAAGVPLFSGDQSQISIDSIGGNDGVASFVLELHKGASAEVSNITVIDQSGASHCQLGGNAVATVISGAVAQTTDLGAAAPELCVVGAPT